MAFFIEPAKSLKSSLLLSLKSSRQNSPTVSFKRTLNGRNFSVELKVETWEMLTVFVVFDGWQWSNRIGVGCRVWIIARTDLVIFVVIFIVVFYLSPSSWRKFIIADQRIQFAGVCTWRLLARLALLHSFVVGFCEITRQAALHSAQPALITINLIIFYFVLIAITFTN